MEALAKALDAQVPAEHTCKLLGRHVGFGAGCTILSLHYSELVLRDCVEDVRVSEGEAKVGEEEVRVGGRSAEENVFRFDVCLSIPPLLSP